MAKREYDAFVNDPKRVPEGKEFNLAIRELTPDDRRFKYRTRYVTAMVFKNPDKEKDDLLWLRFNTGILYDKPFGIRIVKELGPFKVTERSMVSA